MKRFLFLFKKWLSIREASLRLLTLLLLLAGTTVQAQTIRYVRVESAGNGTGSSWANATNNLQNAINASASGDQVWVGTGTYFPSGSFIMKQGVKIYGGFSYFGAPTFTDRNYSAFPTTLQGTGSNVIMNNNNGLTNTAELNGFTITNGSTSNNGAGISNVNSYPSIINCTIRNNNATNWGGGLYNEGSGGSTSVQGCLFYGNSAGGGGAAFDFNGASTKYLNVTFGTNNSGQNGGALHTHGNSNVTVTNSVFWGSTAGGGGTQMYSTPGSSITAAYTLINNSAPTVYGQFNGSNNVSGDALFINPGAGNYRLQAASPAINSGNTTAFGNAATAKDLAFNIRLHNNTIIDMGAYESAHTLSNTIRYVKQGGTGDGSSWANASGNLKNMINNSTNGDQVWVAAGTYQPGVGQSFSMKDGVKIYGGFTTTGSPAWSERNWNTNETILKGNEWSVIQNFESGLILTNTAVLDGFTITNGKGQSGGGIMNYRVSPTLSNLKVINNYVTYQGGGIYNYQSDNVVLNNVIISGNTMGMPTWSGMVGAGMYNRECTLITAKNVLITNNTCNGTDSTGGGIYAYSAPMDFTNVTISGNVATTGAGIWYGASNTAMKNSIIWNNATLNLYSDVTYTNSLVANSGGSASWNTAAGINGGNNIDVNPLFINAAANNYTLDFVSPAKGVGNNAFFENLATAKDVAGNPRLTGTAIDMGAYEQTDPQIYTPDANGILYVVKSAAGNGSSWGSGIGELSMALVVAKKINDITPDKVKQVWVAKGIYKPLYSASNPNSLTSAGKNNSFVLIDNVKVYGHFAGSETTIGQRELGNTANRVILSGDLNGNDTYNTAGQLTGNSDDNAYHVVICVNAGIPLLDGFTITGGSATGGDNLTVNGNYIYQGSGSAITIDSSQPVMANLVIKGNKNGHLGSIYNYNSASQWNNILITANAGSYNCSGFYNEGPLSTPVIVNATITNNTSQSNKTGIYNGGNSIHLKNSILWGNTANNHYVSSNIKYYNCLIQGSADSQNPTMDTYSDDMGGNLDADPLFTNPASGDFTLQQGSPAMESGNTGYYTNAATAKDIAGNPRITGVAIDMGVYEHTNPLIYSPDVNGVMYVIKNATGNGSSWGNAVGELAVAIKQAGKINAVNPGTVQKIWVAAGTYKPMFRPDNLNSSNITDRENTFLLLNDVEIYGHFAGTETTLSQRSLANTANKTILSGDFNNDDAYAANGRITGNYTDNAYHVVMGIGAGVSKMDGFTITGGNAGSGDAVYSNLTVNGTGGIYGTSGSALYFKNSQPVLSNMIIKGNRVEQDGAVYNNNTASQFSNTMITANTSTHSCAGFAHSGGGSPVLVNMTIAGNTAPYDFGGLSCNNGNVHLKNSILWDNTDSASDNHGVLHYNNIVQYAIAPDGEFGYYYGQSMGGNFNTDPLFTNPGTGDFTLNPVSPAIGMGNNDYFTNAATSTDLAGNARITETTIDLGAFENTNPLVYGPDADGIMYVVKGSTGEGTSWDDAIGELAVALKQAGKINAAEPGKVKQIWVAKGTYTPMYRPENLNSGNITDQGNSFLLINDVEVYGHFTGTESEISERNLGNAANVTILSGDFNNNDTYAANGQLTGNYSDNAYRIVMSSGAGVPKISGFTVTGGVTTDSGSALYIENSQPDISNMIIKGNRTGYAGAVYNKNSASVFHNVLITGNISNYICAGFTNTGTSGSPTLVNITISANTSVTNVPGLYCQSGTIHLKNSIIWGNTGAGNEGSISNSGVRHYNNIIQNAIPAGGGLVVYQGQDMGGNLDTDPLFTNPAIGDFTLQPASPAGEAGSNSYYINAIQSQDLLGNTRLSGNFIDMGAIEQSNVTVYTPDSDGVMYVVKDAQGNGTSWSNAVGELSLALKQAKLLNDDTPGRVKQIWVAKGMYKPLLRADNIYRNSTTNRLNAFVLINNVEVYGHFTGNETSISQRNFTNAADKTILSGDLSGDDAYEANGQLIQNSATDNVYHVIISAGVPVTSINGFTVTGGSATGSQQYTSVTVNGIEGISGNRGSGMYISESQPEVSNMIFKGNLDSDGGTIWNQKSSSNIYNTVIISNNSYFNCSGFVNSGADGNPVLTNVTITENKSYLNYTGIYNDYGYITVKNSILWNSASTTFGNYGVTSYYNSLIKGSYTPGSINSFSNMYNPDADMGGNIDANPLFTNAAAGDYSLLLNSPARNAGNTSYLPDAATLTDAAGNARVYGASIDMGAYESQQATDCEITTTWDGTAWSNGLPVSNLFSIVISGNLTLAQTVTGCSLTVTDNAEVIVQSGNSMNIKGAVNVADSALLTFENNAHLVQQDDTANTGNITSHRNSSELYRLDYTFWSSPVAGQNLKAFSPLTVNNRFYKYDTEGNVFVSSSHINFDPLTESFDLARGYLIRTPHTGSDLYNAGTESMVFNGAFTGVPNNGTIDFEMSQLGSRYNLTGNPYPSPLNLTGFFAANTQSIDGTIYIWRKRNAQQVTSAYITINSIGDFTGNNQDGANDPDGVLQTGQGFIVRAKQNAIDTQVHFTNAMRSSSTAHDSSFFRNGSLEKHRLWLDLTNSEGFISQALINYCTGATQQEDMGIDAAYINDSKTSLNSLLNNTPYTIQGRSIPFEDTDVVPMQFKTDVAGQYSINLSRKDGLFEQGQAIYIKDKVTGSLHNIQQGAYNFVTEAGVFNNRFEVHYRQEPLLGNPDNTFNANSVIVYKQNRAIHIATGNTIMKDVKIFDIQGRLIYSDSDVNASQTEISNLQVAEQMLVVQITSTENVTVNRKIIY